MKKELKRSNQAGRGYGADNYYMYTANAVARDYVLEEEAVVTQPQRQVRKVSKKKTLHTIVPNLATLAILFTMGLGLVGQYVYIQNLGYSVSQSKNELKVVLAENEKMKQQCAVLGELQTIEAYAVNYLGMVKPSNQEIIYLPQDAVSPVAQDATVEGVAAQSESDQDKNGTVDKIKGLFAMITNS